MLGADIMNIVHIPTQHLGCQIGTSKRGRLVYALITKDFKTHLRREQTMEPEKSLHPCELPRDLGNHV